MLPKFEPKLTPLCLLSHENDCFTYNFSTSVTKLYLPYICDVINA